MPLVCHVPRSSASMPWRTPRIHHAARCHPRQPKQHNDGQQASLVMAARWAPDGPARQHYSHAICYLLLPATRHTADRCDNTHTYPLLFFIYPIFSICISIFLSRILHHSICSPQCNTLAQLLISVSTNGTGSQLPLKDFGSRVHFRDTIGRAIFE